MWTGAPLLMQVPRERALLYVMVVAACAIAFDVAVRLALIAAMGYGASST